MAAFPVARNSRSFDLPAAAQLSSAAAAAALPPGSPLQSSALPPPPPRAGSAPETEQPAAAEGDQEAAAEAQAAPAPDGGMPLPEGLPPLLSPDYVVNAFVARLAFDLLRRPDFTVGCWIVGAAGLLAVWQAMAALGAVHPCAAPCCSSTYLPAPTLLPMQEYLRARIQRQLGRMQRPEYIQVREVTQHEGRQGRNVAELRRAAAAGGPAQPTCCTEALGLTSVLSPHLSFGSRTDPGGGGCGRGRRGAQPAQPARAAPAGGGHLAAGHV